MAERHSPWENPQQDYKLILAKRRSERRYRSLQLAKTLKILLTKFKKLGVDNRNAEMLDWIDQLENDAEYLDDEDFAAAKKFVSRMQKELTAVSQKVYEKCKQVYKIILISGKVLGCTSTIGWFGHKSVSLKVRKSWISVRVLAGMLITLLRIMR